MTTVVHIGGFSACPYYQRAAAAIRGLAAIFPEQLVAEVQEFADRDAYRAWLFPFRDANLGPKAAAHTSCPIVWLNENEYVGGCDAAVEWSKNFVAGSSPRRERLQAQQVADGVTAEAGYEYDLLVIGGGSGGLACAKEAAGLGARVAVLDFVKPSPHGSKWGLGGTCVNVGCIPKKLMHQAALLGESAVDAPDFGWSNLTKGAHSWEVMREKVQDYIKSLNFGYRVQLREKSVTYLNKLGKFIDAHTIETVDSKGKSVNVTAGRVVIAVGGRPSPLDCPGGEHAISSDDLFSLESSPGKTLVVGAGYVSLECGGFLVGLGLDVTILVRSMLLRGFDRECAGRIKDYMEAHGTKFIMEATPTSVVRTDAGQLHVTFSNGDSGDFDTVIAAVGRTADTAGLNLAGAGVQSNPRNHKLYATNEQTNVPNIYAIGDVLDGRPELTPVAIQAGRLLARRLFAGATDAMDYDLVPTAVFTPIEYGAVGLSEDDAIARYGADAVDSYLSEFAPLEWALPEHRQHGSACYAKVVVRLADQRVLGMHILSPSAGEIIQGFGVALRQGIVYQDLLDTVGIHPIIAEELVQMTISRSSGESTAKAGC